jgi:Pyruvate/2-oxoacid:ferredoxin oxidoreductase gamma subunit
VVAVGALQGATELLPVGSLLGAIRQALAKKSALIELNEQAFVQGREWVRDNGVTH